MPTTDRTTTKGDPSLAEIGDNSEAFARAFDSAIRLQAAMNAERSALNAKISKARKQMKADGIELGQLDATLKMMEWSPAEVREHFDIAQQYAVLARLPVGKRVDLFADAEDEELAEQDWHARGYAAGITGKGVPGVAPKECPPERHQAWLAGWNDSMVKNAPKPLRVVES